MLLNDIGKSPDTTFRKINQHLETNYGFKIAEDVSDRDLVAIMEQIEEEITDLKVKGDDAKASPEISKRLLVLEGVKTLREFAILQLQSPDLENVVNGMCDFVVGNFRLGGMHHTDFDECVGDAMKHYRSSKYRFPDDHIEQRVRQGAMRKLQDLSNTTAPEMGAMVEDGNEDGANPVADSEMQGIEEGNSINDFRARFLKKEKDKGERWGQTPDTERARDTAFGGHTAAMDLDNPVSQHTLKSLANPKLSIKPEQDEPIPMIRDKEGRMVPDPFAIQNQQRKKGIVMKENLVKNLRRLLETEVSQAEVMMAAKEFALELQEMIEKIGRLQNEDLPPVTDQMRETYGTASSSSFQTQIYGAFQGVMDALYTAKGQVDDAVTNMAETGHVDAQTDMDVPVDGMEEPMPDIDADAGDEADLDNLAADLDVGDEFGGAEEEEPLGRSKKMESKESLQKKVLEMKKLVEKAKKLREAHA